MKPCLAEIRALELHLVEMCPLELCSEELCLLEKCALELRLVEIRSLKLCPVELGALKLCLAENCPPELCFAEIRALKLCLAEMCALKLCRNEKAVTHMHRSHFALLFRSMLPFVVCESPMQSNQREPAQVHSIQVGATHVQSFFRSEAIFVGYQQPFDLCPAELPATKRINSFLNIRWHFITCCQLVPPLRINLWLGTPGLLTLLPVALPSLTIIRSRPRRGFFW